ncbi:hypothetical protein [Lactobacillus helveticus]|uniref:Uncharacterized protein n=1 Tax=Lactobacillus helveticus TaxID=1587 RepID=A0A386RDH1_LACHE|nr:hypothetical protein [Lactobacillus helveticus]AHI12074.1 hypothetical protein LBH_1078 [Lactobacillus helveticus H9]AYE61397.1 hypothetical protein BC335_0909 [Lactobacillus helveticus]MBO1882530.1 hypothetical protein [Lactobacillus helveticus]MCD9225052.1 hypothetical protein [Lactobacillus helveticus]NRO08872.1 hypothetical protein [Lactobacillus helveticus]
MSKQKKVRLLKFLNVVVSGINVVISLLIMFNKYQIRKDKKQISDEGHAPLDEN